MVIDDSATPFYLMEKAKEFNPGVPPENSHEEMEGLGGSIEATKNRIIEYRTAKVGISDLEMHLKNLENRLEKARKR